MTTKIPSLSDLLEIRRALEEAAESMADETVEMYQIVGELTEAKTDNIVTALTILQETESTLADRIKELEARKKAASKAKERLKDYVKFHLSLLPEKQLEGKVHKLVLTTGRSVLDQFDMEKLPDHLVTVNAKMTRAEWKEMLNMFRHWGGEEAAAAICADIEWAEAPKKDEIVKRHATEPIEGVVVKATEVLRSY